MNQAIWTWIFAILFVGSAVFGGWIYYDNVYRVGEDTETEDEEAVEEEGCYGMETFTGDQVKLSFDYPETWGDAEETVVNADDITEDIIAAGSSYEITFTENPYLTIKGASPDFESGGIGGVCPIRAFFNGDNQDYQCASQEDSSGEVATCEEITVDSQDTVSYYYVPNNECSILGFEKVLYGVIPDEAFPGYVIELSLNYFGDLDMVEMGTRIAGGGAIGVDYLQELIDEITDSAKGEFASGSYTDYIADLQITQFDAMVDSIQFAD